MIEKVEAGLKACQCGSSDVNLYHFAMFAVECNKCHLSTQWCATEAEAIEAWNTRPREDALEAENAKLRAQVNDLCPIGGLTTLETWQVEKERMMERIAELEAERERNRWISVEERLPEECDAYLTKAIDGTYEILTFTIEPIKSMWDDVKANSFFYKDTLGFLKTADYILEWKPIDQPEKEVEKPTMQETLSELSDVAGRHFEEIDDIRQDIYDSSEKG